MSYTVEANHRIYTIVDDLTTTYQVIVAGRVTAAATGEALRQYRVQVDYPGVFVKVTPDGFFCLAGVPDHLFPELDSTSYLLTLQLDAPFFQSQTLPVDVLMNSTFPLPQLAVAMAYTPVRLQGRVTLDSDGSTVAGSIVRITDPAQTLTLRTPLHFDHVAGTTVNVCTFAPPAPRQLTAAATPPDNQLSLDNAAGLVAGNILQIGDPAVEYVVVAGPGGAPNQVLLQAQVQAAHAPGTTVLRVHRLAAAVALMSNRVTLNDATGLAPGAILQFGEPEQAETMTVDAAGANPGELLLRGGLRRSYPAGTAVRPVVAVPGVQTQTTAQEATAGDGLLSLSGDFPPGPTPVAIEIADAAPARFEYLLLNGLSDSEGYYRLDGISRLETLTLFAAAGPDEHERPWTINPRQPVNVVNFRLQSP